MRWEGGGAVNTCFFCNWPDGRPAGKIRPSVAGTVTAAGQSLAFAGFTSLAGGIANDSFTVTDDSTVDITTDTAIGGTGVDSVSINVGQTLTVTTAIVFGVHGALLAALAGR